MQDSRATEPPITAVKAIIEQTLLFIPSINGADLLERMLPSVRLPPQNIIVLEQGSSDATRQYCARFGAEVIQLQTPRTYTECCNIALDIADQRGAPFFIISNNDVRLVTNVIGEMVDEMTQDPGLGILSCSQVVLSDDKDHGILSYRVAWDLEHTEFHHDLATPSHDVKRLEADFCELTFAMIRTEAAKKIGGFDNEFGFYHEDADFGYCLRMAGYSCAYLPHSQIQHFAGSTFQRGLSGKRLDYIERSRTLFARKHLGRGLNYIDHRSDAPTSWNVVNQNLFPYLSKSGLVDRNKPELVFSHPGTAPFDVLFSVWETSRLPPEWLQYRQSYLATFLPSKWNYQVFTDAGFRNTAYVPLGVETDVYHPWTPQRLPSASPAFLWFARDQYRKGLDVMLKAWRRYRERGLRGRLIIAGHGVLQASGIDKAQMHSWREYISAEDPENSITFRETVKPLSPARVADLYREADYLVLTSRSEGFGFSVVESMACGTVPIFSAYGSTRDMMYEGALTFGGREVEADYSDKRFFDVGCWWEPDLESIVDRMAEAAALDDATRRGLVRKGLNLVRNSFTWRNTCAAISTAISSQPQEPRSPRSFAAAQPLTVSEFAVGLAQDDVNSVDNEQVTLEDFVGFDADFYRGTYPDIVKAREDPLVHFLKIGWIEERLPSPHFSTRGLLASNRKVRSFLLLLANLSGQQEEQRSAARHFTVLQASILAARVEHDELGAKEAVESAYMALLGRVADEDGRDFYLGEVVSRRMTLAQVFEVLATSEEADSRWRLGEARNTEAFSDA